MKIGRRNGNLLRIRKRSVLGWRENPAGYPQSREAHRKGLPPEEGSAILLEESGHSCGTCHIRSMRANWGLSPGGIHIDVGRAAHRQRILRTTRLLYSGRIPKKITAATVNPRSANAACPFRITCIRFSCGRGTSQYHNSSVLVMGCSLFRSVF